MIQTPFDFDAKNSVVFGFLCSDSQVLILLVSHTAFPCAGSCCGCTAVCVHSLSSPLHTQPSNSCTLPSSLWGQRLPSWQHSDSLVAPEMSTQLLRLGGKPCISIKWAFQAKHIHALAAIESGPAVLSVSQGGFYLVYLLNAVKKNKKNERPHIGFSQVWNHHASLPAFHLVFSQSSKLFNWTICHQG